MIYACNNLSLGKDWSQQKKFLESKLKRNDELIILGDLFSTKSPELKTMLELREWILSLNLTVIHVFSKKYEILNTTAGEIVRNVKVQRSDLPFKVKDKKYLISLEDCDHEHMYDKINPDYYICHHDPTLYGGLDNRIKMPNVLHTDDSVGGLVELTESGPIFIENDYSPRKIDLYLTTVDDLSMLEENAKRELPNSINVIVDATLIKDQKFRVQLQEQLKNGGAKTVKITQVEEESKHEITVEVDTEDMFDLNLLKEKIIKSIQERDSIDKNVAIKIFEKTFNAYVQTKR